MIKRLVIGVFACGAIGAVASAQTSKPAKAKSVTYEVTVKAEDTVYTGTMDMALEGGKVTGDMRITSPTEITGKVAGSEKKGVLSLAFPYFMTERKCGGNVTMLITLPAKPGPASGTMEATECGGDPANKVPGTVELVPASAPKK